MTALVLLAALAVCALKDYLHNLERKRWLSERRRLNGSLAGANTLVLRFRGEAEGHKAEAARLRQALNERAPSDADLARGYWP